MFRLKFPIVTALIFAFTCLPALAYAGGTGAFVAVYNSGRAQVRETRVVTLPNGPAAVVFTDVPKTLDPTSIRANAPGMLVQDIQYSYNAITPKNLLDAYVGKELNVILPDPADANARILRKAKLLSNNGRPVFSMGNEVYVGNYEALLLPSMPKGFDAEPTLTLTTSNTEGGKKNVALRYLMGGLSWRADYTMTVDQSGKTAAIDAWATVTNSSDYEFRSADVRLVAGDVQRSGGNYKMARSNQPMMLMEAAAMDAAPPAVEESFSEYHVYTLGRYISLPPQGAKQVSLFSATGVPVEQELISRFHAGHGQRSGVIRQGVESRLKFKNLAAGNLGRPMPAGLVRVFMPTADGSELLAGESNFGHVPDGGEVKLVLGRSFDVTVERTQTSFKRVGKNAFEVGWEISVKNGKSTPQALKLKDSFPGQWKLVAADTPYAKVDSATIQFDLQGLPPTKDKAAKVINYTVRIDYQ